MVFCSDEACCETPLVVRAIESRPFIESILCTPNTLQLGSIYGKVHGGRYYLGKHARKNMESESSLYRCKPGSTYGDANNLNSESAEEEEEEFTFDSHKYLNLVQS